MATIVEKQEQVALAVREAALVVGTCAERLADGAGYVSNALCNHQEPNGLYDLIGKLAVAQDALNVALAGYEAP